MAVLGSVKILVVDDYEPLLRVLRRELEKLGHEVVTVVSCATARAEAGPFDLAVVDLHLTNGLGVDLAAELLGDGTTNAVVFFTSSMDGALVNRASGIAPVIDKDVERLLDFVAKIP